ncbi:hypothetical protein [Nocardiopsis coralliicola]
MQRRTAQRLLAAAIALTVAATTAAVGIGIGAGMLAAVLGLAGTWWVCVACWRVARRPKLFRLVCAPLGQVGGAFVMLGAGYAAAEAVQTRAFGDQLLGGLGAWSIGAGMFVLTSVLFAGFLRTPSFSHPGAAGV